MIDLHVTTVRLPRCSTLDQKKLPEAASGHPGTCAQPNAHRRLIALTVLSAIWPWGSGHAQATPSRPVIALVTKSMDKQFGRAMWDSAKDYQQHNSDQFDLVTASIADDADATAQIAIVHDMIRVKVNAIVLAAVDSKALVPVVASAIGAGIIVIAIDNRLDAAALKDHGIHVPFVGPDDRKGAMRVGDYVATRLGHTDELGIIAGPQNESNAQQRTAGFVDAMRAHGVTVIAVGSGQWQTATANAVAADMLRQHPRIRALLCGNDPMAVGAVKAVEAAHLKGRVYVSGYDNIAPVRQMLKDGTVLATADHFPARQGVFGIDFALKAVAERKKQDELTAFFETPVQLIWRDS